MSFAFVHLSDIHFGQERGGAIIINNDAKERLIDDVEKEISDLPQKAARGIIVTGDVAYGGKKDEYKQAASWLDRVASAAKCGTTDIQVVPGNHDIDRSEISNAAKWMLDEIAKKGEDALDKFLENERDRSLLYRRFSSYIPFAEGYNCSLDCTGGLASERVLELAPGRSLQFIGLNTALVCKHKDKRGQLLLGAKQRVLPTAPGRELVVLCHHPLKWLKDSEDARRFVRNRARVLISGHEHMPAVRVDAIEEGCDLMTLEAGATVPPNVEGPFTYTYNVIEFSWDGQEDRLKVTVNPRAWNDGKKRFEKDPDRLGKPDPTFSLGCPNFRRVGRAADAVDVEVRPEARDRLSAETTEPTGQSVDSAGGAVVKVPNEYPIILLRFFRDLSDAQRLAVLVKLNALPSDWSDASSHALERQILDRLVLAGRLDELKSAIDHEITQP